jgi:hypothetical protein
VKRFLISLVLILGLMLSPTPFVYAVTDGCPDTWKIDTTSLAGYKELQEAKARLGADLALSEPITQYLNYAGELGTLVAPKDLGILTSEDIYLYGKTQVQWKIDVQMKNCLKKTFVINLGTLTEHLRYKNVSTTVDPQIWATANEKSFIDFTKAAQFGACIKSLQLSISPPNLGGQLEGNLLVIGGFRAVLRDRTFNNPCGIFGFLQGAFVIQDLSPECRYFSEQSDRSTAIRKGASCDLALALSTLHIGTRLESASLYQPGSLIVFTKFTIKAKDYEVKVTCVKGKLTKIVTAYRGYEFRVKCPAGYKVKK